MIRILIAAGGSGGHIFPAIALGRALKARRSDAEILYVGSDKDLDRKIFEKEGARFVTLSANKFPRKISPEIIVIFFRLLFDIFRSFIIILKYRPDAAAGFGGYVSFPVILAAKLSGVSSIVHEQNVIPGRANRALFGLADRIALSFDATKKALGRDSGKAILTGNPIRTDRFTCDRVSGIRRFGLDEGKFTILVMGGSQGANFLNNAFIGALSDMDSAKLSGIQIIHITGAKDYDWALGSYGRLGVGHRVHSFVDRIEEAYGAADLVVTRSGASAIFELAFLHKPMILIPYPFAMSHQLENALAFSRNGAAVVMEEKDLIKGKLAGVILDLIRDKVKMDNLKEAALRMALPKAAEDLAMETIAMSGK